MIACKFLSAGAVGLYSGFRWPTPVDGTPGAWVQAEGPLVLGLNGVHAIRASQLVNWLDDELWLTELAGEVEEQEGLVVARRGRLVAPVDAWDAAAARDFTRACVFRAREIAADALARAGHEDEAHALGRLDDVRALQAYAASRAANVDGFAADALAYLADAVELAAGGRPDRYGAHPAADVPASPAAIAANLGFVVAHVGASAVAAALGEPEAYDGGFDGERDRQRVWLVDRLGAALDAQPAGRAPELSLDLGR